MMAVVVLGLTCSLLAGCYTYRPLGGVDAAMPAPGDHVEARLTPMGSASLAPQVGPDVLLLEGQVVSADSAGLTLAVTRSETARRIGTEWKGEHVTLPRGDVASLRERKLSVGATALFGGLAGGGLVGVAALLGGAGGASGTAGGGQGQGHQ